MTDHSLECIQDELGNVIMIRPASKGCEDRKPIMLQGHMDMVCEKEPGCDKDMEKEGLDLFVDSDLIGAKGTTLGGDDGIAIAFALALLEDETLKAPRLEFVCTVSEEVGMDGAHAIDFSPCKARRLINIDSEEEASVIIGCAGGGRMEITLPVIRKASKDAVFELTVDGLLGGHSGTSINEGRANANMLMARILRKLSQSMDISLISFEGGNKDNAIPRISKAVVCVPAGDAGSLKDIVSKEASDIKLIYAQADPDIKVLVKECEAADREALSLEDTRKIIRLLLSLPNGVIRMSSIEGLVETSLNLGVLKLSDKEIKLVYSLRSSVAAAYDALRENMRFMAEGYGADVKVHSEYPAWEYVKDSPLQNAIRDIYRRQNGKDLRVEVIHAGLECGLFAKKLPGVDAISIGPDLFDIHTPNERMSIASVQREYALVRELIETL